jgi:hypothetical protein
MAGRRFDDTEFCWLTEFTDSLKGYVIEGERFCSTYHIIVYHRARTDFWGRCLRRNGHDYGLSRFSEPDRKQCRRVMAWLCCSGQQLRRNPCQCVRKMHNRCFDARRYAWTLALRIHSIRPALGPLAPSSPRTCGLRKSLRTSR